ncbi:MAG: ATP-binding protein [Verrucomicrobiales bacterium]|nr:ATP-binding protein [Verrucomicrobiales bacterium]
MIKSIRNKMILFIALPTVAIYIGVMVWVLAFSKGQAHRFHHQEMRDRAETAAARFDDYISKVAKVSKISAGFISRDQDFSVDQSYAAVVDLVKGNERIYGAGLAFEPGALKPAGELFCAYAHRAGEKVVSKNITREVYDWYGDDKWQWWHLPKKKGHGVWTDPYFDSGAGNVLMMSYATPFYKNDQFYGVAFTDIDLETLYETVGYKIAGNREFYILSRDGRFIFSPNTEEILNKSAFEILQNEGRSDLVEQVRLMLRGESGVVTVGALFEDARHMYAYAPIPSTDWTFVAYMPEQQALTGFRQHLFYVALAFVAALLLILTTIWWVARHLTQPIEQLRETVLQVADGDLEARVDGQFANDEIGDLARNFNRMTTELKGQVLRLAHEEAGREQAEEESRANSDFLSHMSHELRTPLNGILGYAQILQRDQDLPKRQRGSVDSIINCGDHLLSLINDVLDLSKSKAGHLELDEAACDLKKLTREVGDIVRQRARTKGIGFAVELSPQVPQIILTDAAKLRQILVNLLGNAVKFTSEGSVSLQVFKSGEEGLQFDVVDTGVGMTAQELGQIFDPFKQVKAGKAAGGTGLGLAICERLAELMNGKVTVRSQLGKGSTFSLTLPLQHVPEQECQRLQGENADNRKALRLAAGEKATILVADDRVENREILDCLLQGAGFDVVLVDDGDVAVETVKKGGIDLVLMDVHMPRMSGMNAVQMIRQDEQYKELKVVAVTASVSAEFRQKAKQAGFDDFMGKPFWVGELMRILQRHLDVEFVCDDEKGGDCDKAAEAASLGEQDLAGVPGSLVDKLHAAMKIRNLTAIKELAKELEGSGDHSALAQEILKLSAAFDFKELGHLVEKIK